MKEMRWVPLYGATEESAKRIICQQMEVTVPTWEVVEYKLATLEFLVMMATEFCIHHHKHYDGLPCKAIQVGQEMVDEMRLALSVEERTVGE